MTNNQTTKQENRKAKAPMLLYCTLYSLWIVQFTVGQVAYIEHYDMRDRQSSVRVDI